MDDKSQFSIFDDSGAKNKPEEKKTTPTPANPPAEEVKNAIDKLWQQHDIIEKTLDQAYNVIGLSPQEIKNALANPDNFSPQEWEAFQHKQKEFEKLFGKEAKSKTMISPASASPQKMTGDKKEEKKRKGKTLGGRKGWMPM